MIKLLHFLFYWQHVRCIYCVFLLYISTYLHNVPKALRPGNQLKPYSFPTRILTEFCSDFSKNSSAIAKFSPEKLKKLSRYLQDFFGRNFSRILTKIKSEFLSEKLMASANDLYTILQNNGLLKQEIGKYKSLTLILPLTFLF